MTLDGDASRDRIGSWGAWRCSTTDRSPNGSVHDRDPSAVSCGSTPKIPSDELTRSWLTRSAAGSLARTEILFSPLTAVSEMDRWWWQVTPRSSSSTHWNPVRNNPTRPRLRLPPLPPPSVRPRISAARLVRTHLLARSRSALFSRRFSRAEHGAHDGAPCAALMFFTRKHRP